MNNMVFGKTMENVWNQRKTLDGWMIRRGGNNRETKFHSWSVFSENLVTVEKFNKPFYVGMCILDK